MLSNATILTLTAARLFKQLPRLDLRIARSTTFPRLDPLTMYETKFLIGELIIQPSRRHRCFAGVAAPSLRLRAAVATIKMQGKFVLLAT